MSCLYLARIILGIGIISIFVVYYRKIYAVEKDLSLGKTFTYFHSVFLLMAYIFSYVGLTEMGRISFCFSLFFYPFFLTTLLLDRRTIGCFLSGFILVTCCFWGSTVYDLNVQELIYLFLFLQFFVTTITTIVGVFRHRQIAKIYELDNEYPASTAMMLYIATNIAFYTQTLTGSPSSLFFGLYIYILVVIRDIDLLHKYCGELTKQIVVWPNYIYLLSLLSLLSLKYDPKISLFFYIISTIGTYFIKSPKNTHTLIDKIETLLTASKQWQEKNIHKAKKHPKEKTIANISTTFPEVYKSLNISTHTLNYRQ